METEHQIYFENSKNMNTISSESVDLVVTSPPYPMIQMWDDAFIQLNSKIRKALADEQGKLAFEMMNKELDRVWHEIFRILKFGGLACLNIGDATRNIGNHFMLYPNHARILNQMLKIGFSALPEILWRKQTNAPNKFMGSGMLPAGAYVTLEHEHILILRKSAKRVFKSSEEKHMRRESAIFWEERNTWYSDIWLDLKGTGQNLKRDEIRDRSAAFPFEIPYRLINMFSIKGDTVVDPFLGTGTTMLAAIAAGRNSISYEIEPGFRNTILTELSSVLEVSGQKIANRLNSHMDFVNQWFKSGGRLKYENKHYGFPVMTSQETELLFNQPESIAETEKNTFKVRYSSKPQREYRLGRQNSLESEIPTLSTEDIQSKYLHKREIQLKLLD